MVAGWVFLGVSLASCTLQCTALVDMLCAGAPRRDPVARGLLRTVVSRVVAALAYIVLASLSLAFPSATAALAVVTFTAVQFLWITNAALDVQLRRQIAHRPRHRR